jgi:DNA-directed RNA polymerase specialized sigma24 family protein
VVETVRRYSKLPHLWKSSKRLAKLLTSPTEATEPSPALPHVHKLDQRLSDETVTAPVLDYTAGASLADLQRKYSLGRGSVQKILRKQGVRRRRKSLTDAEAALLVERYEAALTIREIAVEQGLPKTTVQDCLAQARMLMRPAARRVSGGSPRRT